MGGCAVWTRGTRLHWTLHSWLEFWPQSLCLIRYISLLQITSNCWPATYLFLITITMGTPNFHCSANWHIYWSYCYEKTQDLTETGPKPLRDDSRERKKKWMKMYVSVHVWIFLGNDSFTCTQRIWNMVKYYKRRVLPNKLCRQLGMLGWGVESRWTLISLSVKWKGQYGLGMKIK